MATSPTPVMVRTGKREATNAEVSGSAPEQRRLWRTMAASLLVRALLALSSFGYLHPDEYLQVRLALALDVTRSGSY